MQARLEAIFKEVFPGLRGPFRNDTVISEINGWDSMTHLSVVMAIEESFNVHFTLAELDSFKKIDDLLIGIRRKQKNDSDHNVCASRISK